MNYITSSFTASFKICYDKLYNYFAIDSTQTESTQPETQAELIQTESTQPETTQPELNERIYKKLSSYEQLIWLFSNPTHVINNIYIGSSYDAANKSILDKYNIKYIINVTVEINNYFPEHITYVNYKIYDNNRDSIKVFLEDSYKKIKAMEKVNNGNILIHCFMGASRSATIVAYYLMRENNLSALEAIEFLKEKRYLVNPTNKLFNELKEAEIKIK